MKQKLLFSLVAVLLLTVTGYSQWVNSGAWPDGSLLGQLHGIAVDPDGKVWLGNFNPEKYLPSGSTDTVTANLIRVFNPDGTPASFSPVWRVVGNGINDTLKGSNVRGMRADHNGNIIITLGNQRMYRVNYQNGEGMSKVILTLGTSPTAPAVSDDGKIFVGPVVNSGSVIQEYDADFNYLGDVVSFSISGFSRSMECSADGNTLYFPSYSRGIIIVYNRPDEFSAFDSVGTIMDGVDCESIAFNKATGNLWVSAGSYNDMPDPPFTPDTWYEFDLSTNQVLDSLKWEFVVPQSPDERPRAIDFSPDGNTAYIGCFGGSGYPLAQKVEKVVSVEDQGEIVVNGYKLSQNYPNPFNPTTKINFELSASGFTTLKIYDMLGNEVATLVQNELTAGSHSVNFNAANLASGTYLYQLNVNGTRITNKMILLK
ncbi:MAG: T9SS type A sorting domain-containing protein [Ignavibacteriota bacterium]|nr:T9SS C-terminal target domain-containing protein [Ignavibacteriota bacterium]MCO6446289.1 T9SS type A sorting domain-containing protein [Ignavibacterium album]QKJ98758.1 MAG: T9SS type A sorting domain-containing protein [Ignavibacteriota bacterium]HOJ08681.1 T9SS type A sorting domain-containing protein [Ignavibacteriaceae bacterium]